MEMLYTRWPSIIPVYPYYKLGGECYIANKFVCMHIVLTAGHIGMPHDPWQTRCFLRLGSLELELQGAFVIPDQLSSGFAVSTDHIHKSHVFVLSVQLPGRKLASFQRYCALHPPPRTSKILLEEVLELVRPFVSRIEGKTNENHDDMNPEHLSLEGSLLVGM